MNARHGVQGATWLTARRAATVLFFSHPHCNVSTIGKKSRNSKTIISVATELQLFLSVLVAQLWSPPRALVLGCFPMCRYSVLLISEMNTIAVTAQKTKTSFPVKARVKQFSCCCCNWCKIERFTKLDRFGIFYACVSSPVFFIQTQLGCRTCHKQVHAKSAHWCNDSKRMLNGGGGGGRSVFHATTRK